MIEVHARKIASIHDTASVCSISNQSIRQLKWIFVLVVPASPCEMFCFVMRPTVRGVGRTPILQSPKTPRHLHAIFLANVWCGVDDGLPIGPFALIVGLYHTGTRNYVISSTGPTLWRPASFQWTSWKHWRFVRMPGYPVRRTSLQFCGIDLVGESGVVADTRCTVVVHDGLCCCQGE
jgi:hypothetical protein